MHIISLGINVQNFILLESWWILLSFCQDGFSKMLPISQETPGYVLNGQFQNLPPQPSKAVGGSQKTSKWGPVKTTFLNKVDVYTVDMVYTDVCGKSFQYKHNELEEVPDHTFQRTFWKNAGGLVLFRPGFTCSQRAFQHLSIVSWLVVTARRTWRLLAPLRLVSAFVQAA